MANQLISGLFRHKLIYLKTSFRYAANGVKCYFGKYVSAARKMKSANIFVFLCFRPLANLVVPLLDFPNKVRALVEISSA